MRGFILQDWTGREVDVCAWLPRRQVDCCPGDRYTARDIDWYLKECLGIFSWPRHFFKADVQLCGDRQGTATLGTEKTNSHDFYAGTDQKFSGKSVLP